MGYQIDHINGNKLDNRAMNLRHVTRSQQNMNLGLRSDNISGHKGISQCVRGRNTYYEVNVKLSGKTKRIGYFKTLEDALVGRKKAERAFYGEYARQTDI